MPIYEYRCQSCGEDFEALVFGGDKVSCPKCKGEQLERKMSNFAHKSEGGKMVSSSSGCSGCTATSCASCH